MYQNDTLPNEGHPEAAESIGAPHVADKPSEGANASPASPCCPLSPPGETLHRCLGCGAALSGRRRKWCAACARNANKRQARLTALRKQEELKAPYRVRRQRSGWRNCLKCGRRFLSPNVITRHLCDDCAHKNMGIGGCRGTLGPVSGLINVPMEPWFDDEPLKKGDGQC